MGLWLRGIIQIIYVVNIVGLLFVPVGAKGTVTGRATCESTGLGEPARVTCHYRENVVDAGYVSTVSLLRDTGGKEEKVVECLRLFNDNFHCLMEAGYELNGAVSNQMIINIPRARSEHLGTYYCELGIQETEFQMESCDLEYKEPYDAATSTPPPEQDRDDHLKGDSGTSNASEWTIAASVLLLVLMMIAVLVFAAVLFVLRRLRRRRKRRQQNTGENFLQDKVDSLLPTSNNVGGPCNKNVCQFSSNLTEVDDFRPGVTTCDSWYDYDYNATTIHQ